MATTETTTPNTSSSYSYPLIIRRRFALRFLKTLKTMNNHYSSHRIKRAAYSSMARTVGSSRVWSRALLTKLRLASCRRRRSRSRRRLLLPAAAAAAAACSSRNIISSKKMKKNNKRKKKMGGIKRVAGGKMDELRRVVPGGKEIDDVWCLFEETAHFIQCLATQVKVMQCILDHYTNTPAHDQRP